MEAVKKPATSSSEPQEVSAAGRELAARIRSREARVGVIGLGYVGLPLALSFAEVGFDVTGIDVDRRKVDRLAAGRTEITDVPDEQLAGALEAGRFRPTTDAAALEEMDAVSICVPTPLRKTRDPDLTYIIQATETVASHLRSGQLVVLESTTYPGTTEEVVLPRLEETGLQVGEDFFLAFSPERVDPGNERYKTRDIPKVVGGTTPRCGELAGLLYGQIVRHVVQVSSTRVAEVVKLLENTFRSVNIALVNEFAQMCTYLGVDVWETIHAAATKPFGFMPFWPGPGLGGHCIPIDPMYLQWKARLDGFEPQFIQLADQINGGMPRFVVVRAMELLNDRSRPMRGARIHLLGVTYKKDINDVRESPALQILQEMQRRGAELSYSDPFVPQLTVGDLELISEEPEPELLASKDLVLIVTDHSCFDYARIVDSAPLVFDTRNATRDLRAPHLERL